MLRVQPLRSKERLTVAAPAPTQRLQVANMGARRTTPLPTQAPPDRGSFVDFVGRGLSRTYDQVNPLDGGRTWQQRAPVNDFSVAKQLSQSARNQGTGIGLRGVRSAVGFAEGASGFYDWISPGHGVNRATQALGRFAKTVDETALAEGANTAYQASAVPIELLTFKGIGSGAKQVIKRGPQALNTGAAAYTKAIDKAADFIAKDAGKIGRATSFGVRKGFTPDVVAADTVMTNKYLGEESSRGIAITPTRLATEAGTALLGGIGGEVVGESINRLVRKSTGQKPQVRVKDTPSGPPDVQLPDELKPRTVGTPIEVQDALTEQDVRLAIGNGARESSKTNPGIARAFTQTGSRDPLTLTIQDLANRGDNKGIRKIVDQLLPDAPESVKRSLSKQIQKTSNPLDVQELIADATKAENIKVWKTQSSKPKVRIRDKTQVERIRLENKAKTQVLNINEKSRLRELRAVEAKTIPPKPDDVNPNNVADIDNSIDANDPFKNDSFFGRLKNDLSQIVDNDGPMIRMLKKAEKQSGVTGLVESWQFRSGNIRASNSMANAKINNSEDLSNAFRGLSKEDIDRFDLYSAARAESRNYSGKKTSRSSEENRAILEAGDAEFGERFAALNNYYKGMADDMYKAGIISRKKLAFYKSSDDYVRIQRDMDDLLNAGSGKSGSRSFGSTSTSKRRTGSDREVQSVSGTAIQRTQEIELEIARNKAARESISMLKATGLARRVKRRSKKTVAFFNNGKEEFYEVHKDLKEVIENVNPYSLGVLQKIVSAPVRLLRAGATGRSLAFAFINYMRDQISSAIYSKDVLATHRPDRIISAFASAARDFGGESKDPLWKKFAEYTGDQTLYDELRNSKNTQRVLREIREGQKGKLKNMVDSPGSMARTLEDLIGIAESATRFQNFKGTYEAAIKEGLGEDTAIQKAVLAARQNSVDFQSGSDFTRTMNLFIPYFNAGVQGSRNVARSFRDRPVVTSMKSIGFVAMPAVAATIYNYADADRRAAYESINDYEKEDNFIIVGPNAKQNDDGTWEGVYKIPKPQGYRELTDPVRELTESFMSGEPVENVERMFADMIGGLTGPVSTSSPMSFLGSMIPQQLKPTVQQFANKDFYRGKDIVSDYMMEETDDPTKRAYENTSGTARKIANVLGVSPIQVEKFIEDSSASLGRMGINASDNVLAKAGVIPEEQIGGKSVLSDLKGRMAEARGELLDDNKSDGRKYYDDVGTAVEGMNLSKNEQAAFDSIYPSKKNFLGDEINQKTYYDSAHKANTFLRYPKVFETSKQINELQKKRGKEGDPLYDLSPDKQRLILQIGTLGSSPGNREAAAILKLNPWIGDYYDKRGQFFDRIKEGQTPEEQAKSGVDPAGMTVPRADKGLQSKIDAVNNLKDPASRGQFYADNPDITEYFQKQSEYQDAKRAFMGLPLFDPYPRAPEKVQGYMDEYNSLPRNDGPAKRDGTPSSPNRSAWIRANQDKFDAMTKEWNKKAEYDLARAGSLAVYEGIDFEEDDYKDMQNVARNEGGGGSGFGGGFGGGGRGRGRGGGGGGRTANAGSTHKYAVSRTSGGKGAKPTVSIKKTAALKSNRGAVKKPKVSMKRSQV